MIGSRDSYPGVVVGIAFVSRSASALARREGAARRPYEGSVRANLTVGHQTMPPPHEHATTGAPTTPPAAINVSALTRQKGIGLRSAAIHYETPDARSSTTEGRTMRKFALLALLAYGDERGRCG
jgi:hypothetical protein